jgi:ribose/xylose/arabinose/galactoside ABC-type transport system permease subunit
MIVRRRIGQMAPLAVALLVAAAALIAEPGFYDAANLRNVARQAAFLGVVALGQLLVVIVRGLDLSVGAVITTTLLLIVEMSGTRAGSVPAALVAVVAMAVAVGTLNAVLVVVRRVPAILATLGTYVFVQGVGLWVTEGRSRGRVPDAIKPLGTGHIGPIPVPMIIATIVAIIVAVVLHRGWLGRSMYAVGANPDASYLSGIARRRVAGLAFVACSLLAMVSGLMLSGFVGFYDRSLGVGYDIDSIAAVVLGGASLAGGSGTVAGTLAAVVGLAALDNLLLIAGVEPSVKLIGKALVLFVAVLSAGWLSTSRFEEAAGTVEAVATPPRVKGVRG